MEYTSLLILIVAFGLSGVHTLDLPENEEHADRFRGRLDRSPPRPRKRNPMVTTKVTADVPITTQTPNTTRKPNTTTKTPSTTTLTPQITGITTKLPSPNTPTRLPSVPRRRFSPFVPSWATTNVTADVPITIKIPNTTRKPITTRTPATRKPHSTTEPTLLTPDITRLIPSTKPTTRNTPRPLSLDITGARLKYVRGTTGDKVFKHTFHENMEIRLNCTFQTQRTPHVLKLMNEFGQGSQMNSDNDYTDVASISYTFRINSDSKYIYCIAMDTAGRTLLTTVDLEYVAPISGSDCRSDEHLQPGKLVVIKDQLPPLLWTVGLVFEVFPAVDNSSISVAQVLTGRGGGVPIIKPFTDLCPLNE